MGIWIFLGFDFFPIHFYIPYTPATLRDGSAVMDLVPFMRPWLARLVFIKCMVIVVEATSIHCSIFYSVGVKAWGNGRYYSSFILNPQHVPYISLLVDSGRATLGIHIYGSGII